MALHIFETEKKYIFMLLPKEVNAAMTHHHSVKVKVKEGKVFALNQKEVGFPGIVLRIFTKKINHEIVFLEKSLEKLLCLIYRKLSFLWTTESNGEICGIVV